jgi:hypothetical protein
MFTKAHARVLAPALTYLDPALPADIGKRHPLAAAWRTLDRELDRFFGDHRDRRKQYQAAQIAPHGKATGPSRHAHLVTHSYLSHTGRSHSAAWSSS